MAPRSVLHNSRYLRANSCWPSAGEALAFGLLHDVWRSLRRRSSCGARHGGAFIALTAEVATADVIPACVRRRRQPRWNASAKRRSVGERWRGRQRRSADTGIGSPSCAL